MTFIPDDDLSGDIDAFADHLPDTSSAGSEDLDAAGHEEFASHLSASAAGSDSTFTDAVSDAMDAAVHTLFATGDLVDEQQPELGHVDTGIAFESTTDFD